MQSSKVSRSENRAKLYLTHKDHKKEQEKTRPIGTANSSNTRAFANSVSDLLEAVASEREEKYEVISSEDMLHSVQEHNIKVKELGEGDKKRIERKRSCWSCKAWTKKCGPHGRKYEEKREEVEEVAEIINYILETTIEMSECRSSRKECEECESLVKKISSRHCKDCGEGIQDEDMTFSLVGMDAVALFPSLSGKRTARIVRRRVARSNLKFEGFNWKKAVIYVMTNKHLISSIPKEIKKFFPIRKSNKGTTPGLSSKSMKNKENSEDEQWYFHRKNPPEEVLRELIGMVAEVGIRILWSNYCYDFGGETYIQEEGGPIGQRPTMAASRLVVEDFFECYEEILKKAELRVTLMKVYVDDGRQATSLLRKGMRFSK